MAPTDTLVEPVEAPNVPLPQDPRDDVVVLPREIADDGRGLYDDSVITIVKEFRAAGVAASYQHDPDSRGWIGEKWVPIEAIDLVIGICSNAGWAALCLILRRKHKSDQVRVRVGRFRKTVNGISWDWYKVEGPGAAAAEALAAIEGSTERATSIEQEETKALEEP